jgi:hypothetical protein
MEQKTSPEQFDDRWPLQEPEEVLGDKNLQFPPLAQRQITGDGTARVCWNYHPDLSVVFVSQEARRKKPYEFADTNDLDNNGDNTYIRAPDKLPDEILNRFRLKGTYMVYLASPEMLTDDNPSTWILSWKQFASLCGVPDQDPPEDIERIYDLNPGLIRSFRF